MAANDGNMYCFLSPGDSVVSDLFEDIFLTRPFGKHFGHVIVGTSNATKRLTFLLGRSTGRPHMVFPPPMSRPLSRIEPRRRQDHFGGALGVL